MIQVSPCARLSYKSSGACGLEHVLCNRQGGPTQDSGRHASARRAAVTNLRHGGTERRHVVSGLVGRGGRTCGGKFHPVFSPNCCSTCPRTSSASHSTPRRSRHSRLPYGPPGIMPPPPPPPPTPRAAILAPGRGPDGWYTYRREGDIGKARRETRRCRSSPVQTGSRQGLRSYAHRGRGSGNVSPSLFQGLQDRFIRMLRANGPRKR